MIYMTASLKLNFWYITVKTVCISILSQIYNGKIVVNSTDEERDTYFNALFLGYRHIFITKSITSPLINKHTHTHTQIDILFNDTNLKH